MNLKPAAVLLGILALATLASLLATPASIPAPANRTFSIPEPFDTSQAKAAALEMLRNRSRSERVVLAQQLGEFGWDEANARANLARFSQTFNRTPVIIGFGFGWDEVTYPSQETLDRIVEHARRGGLVTFILDPRNPLTQGSVRDRSSGNQTLASMLTPGTGAHAQWRRHLEVVADTFQYLQAHGVVVLFRPYHEMNGDWFWWGHAPVSDYVQIYRQTHAYLTQDRNLSNLLWVYSPMVEVSDHVRPTEAYYPGDAYVDVISLDYYSGSAGGLDANGSASKLARFGKPLALETGPDDGHRDGSFDARTYLAYKQALPNLAYILVWNSWPGARMTLVETRYGADAVQDARVDTLPSTNG